MEGVVDGAGVELAYRREGAGRPLLLIHDLGSDGAALAPLSAALAPGADVVAYDRRGYGGSGAPEPYEATTVSEQAEDAAAVLGALAAEPAVVCGIGFGALVALDLTLRHRALVAAVALVDLPLYAFDAEGSAELSQQRAGLERSLREGGPEQAVAAWLSGRRSAAELARAQGAHRAVFADLSGVATLEVRRAALRALDVPVAVATTADASPALLHVADAVVALLPAARRMHVADPAAAVRGLLVP